MYIIFFFNYFSSMFFLIYFFLFVYLSEFLFFLFFLFLSVVFYFFFFFNDTATTEIYTLSLHDALPIFCHAVVPNRKRFFVADNCHPQTIAVVQTRAKPLRIEINIGDYSRFKFDSTVFGDRKSTRLNSSHSSISYAVFCLKKKKK